MPSATMREFEAKVSRVIIDAGATIIEKGSTNGGHNRIVFERGGEQRTYHYARTPSDHRAGKNFLADVRRMIRELPETTAPVPRPAVKSVAAKKAPAGARPPQPATKKLTAQRRKDIAKRYLLADNLAQLCHAEKLDQVQAEIVIFGQKGQAAEKLTKEKHLLAAQMAKRMRKPVTKKKHTSARRLSSLDISRRNRKIFVYASYGMKPEELAELFSIPVSRIQKIVKQEEENAE